MESRFLAMLRVYSGTPGWVERRHFFRTLTTGKVTSPNPTGGTRIDPLVLWLGREYYRDMYGNTGEMELLTSDLGDHFGDECGIPKVLEFS
ncbi:hypothetical protein AVEN_236687-1 [Araneus ventricosus]|uniref:Uncharacterized protein n=1 Tax=Araneus ventricosus TaxID=182803 RepID=A0A4Y2TCW6_ARAVE|nr:hypothetical protein AVEN_236687-1 [Araneus ventricosus]